jgi:type I site-specific restriction endonuclease
LLAAVGWGGGCRIRREYLITLGRIQSHGKRGKALTSDHVLEYRNTKLAVVEAKASSDKPLTEGVGQAKDYAGKLAIRFNYACNGQCIYGIDMDTDIEGELVAFLSPDTRIRVEVFEQVKLTPLLRLKYQNSIADAIADLGRPEEIGKIFAGFQRYLYQ